MAPGPIEGGPKTRFRAGGDAPASPPADFSEAQLTVIPTRHYGRWVIAAILLWFGVFGVRDVFTNKNIDHPTVYHFLFDHQVMIGLEHTILITVLAMLMAVVLGTVIAAMRTSANPMAQFLAWLYAFVFRGTPVLVQIIFWFNLALIWKRIVLGIPGTGLELHSWNTNDVMTPLASSVIALGLAESAYMSEIVRGGLLGVEHGQTEAAQSLGLTNLKMFRLIVLPQALRIIIPPTGNEVIGMLKLSALASVIGYTDLAGTAAQIYSNNLRTIELLLVISFWYVVCTTVLSAVQYFVERHYGRGHARASQRSPYQIFRTTIRLGRDRA